MSKKVLRPPFSWVVRIHDFNADAVRSHDVLAYREDRIKKLKKKCATKEEFAKALDMATAKDPRIVDVLSTKGSL